MSNPKLGPILGHLDTRCSYYLPGHHYGGTYGGRLIHVYQCMYQCVCIHSGVCGGVHSGVLYGVLSTYISNYTKYLKCLSSTYHGSWFGVF